MKPFTPYSIRHLGITEITEKSLPDSNSLCYIWWNDIPLGHLWTGQELVWTIATFRERLLEQVRPAIAYYLICNDPNNPGNEEWESFFRDGANDKLENFLATLLRPFQLSALPDNDDPISIVICTRNRAVYLETCINAIMENSDKHFELLVVDNAPDDDSTKSVVSRFSSARYLLEPRKGLDIARNTGARNASHDIIAYTDDDVIVEKDWVKKIKKCFSDPTVLSVTGQVIPVALEKKPQYMFERYWGFNKGYRPVLFDYGYFKAYEDFGVPVWNIGAGANMAFRKEAFDIAGWFDERLDVGAAGCSGDSEFWYRILAERWNCLYCPQVYVYHNHRDTEKSLKNQIFNYMKGQVASLLVQYEQYGHKGNLVHIRKALPRYYFGRMYRRIIKGYSEDFGSIGTEIRGYISGIRFFRSERKNKRKDVPVYNQKLYQPAVVSEHTLVSVIITCYNYGRYLQQAIESVTNQTHQNTEIIVVDDGSTDNTQEILKKYTNVKSVKVQRVGLSAARNIGVQHSRGSFLIFLDADDYLYANAVQLNLYYFSYYPQAVFVSGGHDRVSDEGITFPGDEQDEHYGNNYISLLRGNYIGMEATVMYRRELFYSFHFNTALSLGEDYDINLRISRHFPVYSHTQKIAAYRMHNSNMSGDKNKMLKTVLDILRTQHDHDLSPEEKNALKAGIGNWTHFYLNSDKS
jgi:glycosyltransferase involved in cell wall biosynthesis